MQKSYKVTEETIQEALDNIEFWGCKEFNGFLKPFCCPIYNSIPGCYKVNYNYIEIDEIDEIDEIEYVSTSYKCTPELEQWQRVGVGGKNPGHITVILDDMANGRKVARLRRRVRK